VVDCWWIRHGESTANAGGRADDPRQVPLTEAGERQAREVAAAIEVEPSLVVVSPYLRTRLTAAPLIARWPSVPVVEWPIHEFTVLSSATMRDTTGLERAVRARPYWDRNDPESRDGDGAESFCDLTARASGALKRLRSMDEGTVVLFSHQRFMLAVIDLIMQPWPRCEAAGAMPTRMRLFRAFLECWEIPNGALLRMLLGPTEWPSHCRIEPLRMLANAAPGRRGASH